MFFLKPKSRHVTPLLKTFRRLPFETMMKSQLPTLVCRVLCELTSPAPSPLALSIHSGHSGLSGSWETPSSFPSQGLGLALPGLCSHLSPNLLHMASCFSGSHNHFRCLPQEAFSGLSSNQHPSPLCRMDPEIVHLVFLICVLGT